MPRTRRGQNKKQTKSHGLGKGRGVVQQEANAYKYVSRPTGSKKKSPVGRNVATTNKQLQDFLAFHGLTLQSNKDGSDYFLTSKSLLDPRGKPPQGFDEYWREEAYLIDGNGDFDRKNRYKSYDFMDSNSAESTMTLDTYADESVATGMDEDSPVIIEMNNKSLKDKIMEILRKNGILSQINDGYMAQRDVIRDLAKYGDVFFKLQRTTDDGDISIFRIRNPLQISVIEEPDTGNTVGYMMRDDVDNVDQAIQYLPWEFAHFKVNDSKFKPYGRSVLEPMRAPFAQLIIVENLLAVSRASKVDRLVLRVPTTASSNPMATYNQMNSYRSQIFSMVFGSGNDTRSKSKHTAATEVLLMPSGKDYALEKLSSSSINIAATDDVEYFMNKMYAASRLPKGYLLADKTIRVEEGALQAQDLKFARAILPLQHAYAAGLSDLITSLIILLGHDPVKQKLVVKVAKPQAVAKFIVKELNTMVTGIGSVWNFFSENVKIPGLKEKPKMSPDQWVQVMKSAVGIPEYVLREIADFDYVNQKPKEVKEGEDVKVEYEKRRFTFYEGDKTIHQWNLTSEGVRDWQVSNTEKLNIMVNERKFLVVKKPARIEIQKQEDFLGYDALLDGNQVDDSV